MRDLPTYNFIAQPRFLFFAVCCSETAQLFGVVNETIMEEAQSVWFVPASTNTFPAVSAVRN